MKFVDEAIIEVRSGHGGPGAVHFRREKYRPKMGPDGGDGGRGGDVYFVPTHQMQSLMDFRFQARYEAQDGEKGTGASKNGKGGEDLLIQVPVGTQLFDADTGEFLADLVEVDSKVLLLKGGRGGLGNVNFANSVRQAPDFAQPGLPGKSRRVRMELKLLADVALIGFPNAGKSTLISRWSAARPKIADYPFTTLVPNLGVVRAKGLDFVLADIPGIIEGASEGKGLGHQFLKHSERTRLLLMLLDTDPFNGRTLLEEFETLYSEMTAFSEELGKKPMIVALTKHDLESDLEEKQYQQLLALLKKKKLPEPKIISSKTGFGLEQLQEEVVAELQKLGPRVYQNEIAPIVQLGNKELFGDQIDDEE